MIINLSKLHLAIFVATLFCLQPIFALASEIQKIEWYDTAKDTLQFEITLDQKTKFKAYKDHNAKKMIIDLQNAKITPETQSKIIRKKNIVENLHFQIKKTQNIILIFELNNNLKDIKATSKFIKKKKYLIKLVAKYITPSKQKDFPSATGYNNKKKIIIIDAGHGGNDCGAIGVTLKLQEKNITLAFAKELKSSLEATGKYQIYLTRENDQFLSLNKRKDFTKAKNADIFISLHADSHTNPNFRGASVYTLSEQAYDNNDTQKELKKVKNIDLSKEKQNIAELIVDLVRRDAKNHASKLAIITTNSLRKNIILLKSAHRFAGFKVLNGVDIPAILIELGYLSNQEDESLLNSPSYRLKIVKSIVTAINKHFSTLNTNSG